MAFRYWILGLAMIAACGCCEAAGWYAPMLPDAVAGWRASGPVKLVDKSNIFDYMDGAGELYLAYDFKALAVREYTQPSQPKITAEVYRMGSSAEAYGVYSHERGAGGPVEIGQDTDYGFGLLRFWKSTFFVRVLAEKETPESKAAILAIGKHAAQGISETGKRPTILSLLPKIGLIPQSVHYFHEQSVLNFHFYLSDANILDLGDKTEAVLAQYKIDSTKPRLLVVRYASAKDASAAYTQFEKAYFKDKPAAKGTSRIEAVEHGEFTGIRRTASILRLVFEAKTREAAQRLLLPATR